MAGGGLYGVRSLDTGLVRLLHELESLAEVDGCQGVLLHLEMDHAQVVEIELWMGRLALGNYRVLFDIVVLLEGARGMDFSALVIIRNCSYRDLAIRLLQVL